MNQGKQRHDQLECELKRQRMEFNEISKFDLTNRKIINDLRNENKEMESLKKELEDKNDLIQQTQLELQYSKLENEKLTIMSSYKDSQLVELRNAIKLVIKNHLNL